MLVTYTFRIYLSNISIPTPNVFWVVNGIPFDFKIIWFKNLLNHVHGRNSQWKTILGILGKTFRITERNLQNVPT